MLSNVALSHEGKFGETTAIIDRCVFESAIKIIWLCDSASQEEFNKYLADGLKTKLELKAHIEASIETNGGVALPIETRMLRSINNHIAASGLTEAEIISSKRFRGVAAIIEGLGLDRRLYITAQRIGSHHVHGTWSSLLFHYLEEEDGRAPFWFAPRGHERNPAPEGPHPFPPRWKHEDAASPSAGRPWMYEAPVSVCGGFFVPILLPKLAMGEAFVQIEH